MRVKKGGKREGGWCLVGLHEYNGVKKKNSPPPINFSSTFSSVLRKIVFFLRREKKKIGSFVCALKAGKQKGVKKLC